MHECVHERTTVRWKNQNIGMIGRQCDDCGKAVGSWLKHSEVPNIKSLEQWIERGETVIPDERMPLLDTDGKVVKYIDREAYHQYLRSPVWKRRRDKVIARAAGVCEGCLSAPAVDVHHLTYRHVFAEFAFELIALCRECHSRIHEV